MDHEAAHGVFEQHLDRLVDEAFVREAPAEGRGWITWVGAVALRHQLVAHLHHEEANLVVAIPRERAPDTLIRDHEQLREALSTLEQRALDQAFGLAHASRLVMAVAQLEALLEHHDRRERSLYEGLDGLGALPDVAPPLDRAGAMKLLQAPTVQGAQGRCQAWIDGKPLPPLDTDDEAFARLLARDDRLVEREVPDEPRQALAHRRRVELTLRSTLRYALLHTSALARAAL